MAINRGGQHSGRRAGWLALLLLLTPLAAQDADDPASVTALLREAVDTIHANAYRTEPKTVICTKALNGLTTALGGSATQHAQDFSGMLEDAAVPALVTQLQAIADSPGQRLSLRELAERSLQAWCRQHDAYTRYDRSGDVALIRRLTKASGSGIGMSVLTKNNSFFCYPLPGSPAEASGIKSGDRLLSVDGNPVDDRPLDYLAAVIRGNPGTEVSLRVEHGFGRAETVRVTREALTSPSVIASKKLSGVTLQVRKFSKELVAETRTALAGFTDGATLTLDMRGCPGGDLDVAIAFAGLFLEPGEPIVTIRQRGRPDDVVKATQARAFKPAAVVCLQDEGTASAAELVIAALVHSPNARGASRGTKTHGKGVTQNRYELRGGGRLDLTTGELIAPQGRTWDLTGLLPSMDNRGRIFPKD